MIGRDEELRALVEFLDGVDLLPAAAVVEGEAGAGKSTLFAAAVAAAGDRSYRLLSARPAEPERDLSFAALRDLLTEAFDDVSSELPVPQRRALAVALLREDPSGPPPDRGAVASAVLGALRSCARDGPVLVAVDDAHWLDRASASALRFAARRLRDEPVGLLLTRRVDAAGDGWPGLDDSLPDDRVRRLGLRPLSIGALLVLLRTRLGLVLQRPALRRLHEAAGGNPFFALEIGRELLERADPADPAEPLPVPPTLRALVAGRISRLSEGARALLPAIAVLSRPTEGVLEALTAAPLKPALEEAVKAEVLFWEADRLRFTHPLLAAEVYAELRPSERRELHRRLARVTPEPEERARHLARAAAEPDREVATALDAAARTALARGAPSAAAELAEEARRLSPADPVADVHRRSIECARYHFLAGDTSRAGALLTDALAALPPGPLRAEPLSLLARIHLFTDELGLATDRLEQATAEARGGALRAEAEEGLVWSLILARRDLRSAARHARKAVELAGRAGVEEILAEAIVAQGASDFLLGRRSGVDLVERAVEMSRGREYWRTIAHPDWTHAVVLAWSDDLEAARAKLEAVRDRAVERGDESSLPRVLFALSHVHLLRGDWRAAARYAEQGQEAALQDGQKPQVGLLLFSKAVVDAHRGEFEAARASAQGALEAGSGGGAEVAEMIARLTLGFVELSLGDAAEAHRNLAPLVEQMATAGIAEPGAIRFVPDEIEALVHLGELEAAEALLSRHESRARRSKRASARAACSRCRGLLLAARGDFPASLAAFDSALAQHDLAPMPFERARTLLTLGATQRRAKQKRAARTSLSEALGTFRRLGAAVWARAAEAELARIGGRVPSGELTEAERRVAELVAEGRSNKEAAAALFVTAKTVEATLTRVYAKLGVRSRTALARLIASGPSGPASEPVRKL